MLINILLILFLLSFIIFLIFNNLFKFWQKQGIKSIPSSIPFGNFGPVFLLRLSFGVLVKKLYDSTTEPFIGIYAAIQPILLVRDPKLIQAICISHYQSFHDRGVYIDEKYDLLSCHLFALSGERYKVLRQKLSPLFTLGKLKLTFPIILKCSQPLKRQIDQLATRNSIVNVREFAVRYSTDVIGNVIFGLDINCIDNVNEEFRQIGQKMFDPSIKNGLRLSTFLLWPEIQKFFKIKIFGDETEKYMISLVKRNIEYREMNNIKRNDVFQSLMDLRDAQVIGGNDGKTFSPSEIAAQLLLFYVAGFDTSSSAISFCLYELAKSPERQRKVHEEIDQILQTHNNEITLESIGDMKYLELCVYEIIRLYPVLPVMNRKCTAPYKIPDSDYTIKLGTHIMIPVFALNRDPKYFPNPDAFIPERFENDGLKKSFIEQPFMPFGEGPKICIGMRMGIVQTMIGLIQMLRDSTYKLAMGMESSITFNPRHYAISSKSGLFLEVSSRG